MKIVLHAHSTWSYDGVWDLAQIAKFYGWLGVDVVMMTEHDTGFDPDSFDRYRAECAAVSSRRCTLIPGIEYSSPDNDIHILTWGLNEFFAEHQPVGDILSYVRENGGTAVFAHPIRRNAWRKFDPDWIGYLSGIELWNRKSDGITAGPEAYELIRQSGLPATVGQDFHRLRHFYPLTMRADVDGTGDLEATLVQKISEGGMEPCAFGRPVLGPDGTLNTERHDRAETVRRKLRDMRNSLRSGSTGKK